MLISAFAVSCVFLVCYLIYHYNVGSVKFPRPGWVRNVYWTILFTHTVLAVTVPVLLSSLSIARSVAALISIARLRVGLSRSGSMSASPELSCI